MGTTVCVIFIGEPKASFYGKCIKLADSLKTNGIGRPWDPLAKKKPPRIWSMMFFCVSFWPTGILHLDQRRFFSFFLSPHLSKKEELRQYSFFLSFLLSLSPSFDIMHIRQSGESEWWRQPSMIHSEVYYRVSQLQYHHNIFEIEIPCILVTNTGGFMMSTINDTYMWSLVVQSVSTSQVTTYDDSTVVHAYSGQRLIRFDA